MSIRARCQPSMCPPPAAEPRSWRLSSSRGSRFPCSSCRPFAREPPPSIVTNPFTTSRRCRASCSMISPAPMCWRRCSRHRACGAVSVRRWSLWRRFLCCRAARPRNRRTHGPRRATRRHGAHGSRAGFAAGWRGHRCRRAGGGSGRCRARNRRPRNGRPRPSNYVGVVLAIATVTFVAGYVPALRAASVDPVDALRSE